MASTDITAALKTDVDMNNNTSAHESISNPVTTGTSTAAKSVVKSVDVADNYGADVWTFVVPVNATFTSN